MNNLLRAAGASIVAVAALAAVPATAAELLTNGSFEDLGAAVAEGWGGYTYYFDGSVELPGWDVETGSVDVTTNASPWRPADTGNNSLDINGWEAGKIVQSFNTVAGATYTVKYAYSRNQAGAPDPAQAYVTAGGTQVLVSAANDPSFGSYGNMIWKYGSFNFVGTGGLQSISLEAITQGNGGVFFDSVSVSGAIPEPATWAMMIAGFGLAGATLRRRRAIAA